jgi:hypothetical protein
MLLPRELDMIAAGKQTPLPVPKPNFAKIEVRKDNGKEKADAAKSADDTRAATRTRRQVTDTQSRDRAAAPTYPVSASHASRYPARVTAR